MNEPLSHRERRSGANARVARGVSVRIRETLPRIRTLICLPLEAPLPEREGRNLSPDVRHARYRRNVALAIKLERLRLARRALADRKRTLQRVLHGVALDRGQRGGAGGVGLEGRG